MIFAFSFIFNQTKHIMDEKIKALEIWKDLKSRYSQGDLLPISDLQQEVSSIRQVIPQLMITF